MQHDNPQLLLDNQICFGLWLASKSLTQLYQPLLEPLDVTYPQYLALLVLWEADELTVKALGERLHLDSGTLSPLLKKLEAKNLISRSRDPADERAMRIALTAKGRALRKKAATIPDCLAAKLNLSKKELATLHAALKNFNQALAAGAT
jgi:DNA-binding MarR family transcriptional regulator